MAPWIPFWKLFGFGLYVLLYMVTCQSTWDYPPETIRTVIFKLLPMFQLILITKSSAHDDAGYPRYKANIVYGLLMSMGGDAMLVWRVSMFIPGLLFFALAHVFYLRAFGFRPLGSGPTAVSCFILAGVTFTSVAPVYTADPVMYLMIVMYCQLIFTMIWRSVVCLQTWPGLGSVCACVGAILFFLSDFMIAFDKFRQPIVGAPFYVMTTYFAAQMLISLSVACYESRPPVKSG